MGGNFEVTPGPQMITYHFYSQQKFHLKNIYIYLCLLKDFNGWIKKYIKTIPKSILFERYNQ